MTHAPSAQPIDVRRRAAPLLRDGDVVLTDPRRRAEPGDLVVVRSANGFAVCRLEEVEPGDEILGTVFGVHQDF